MLLGVYFATRNSHVRLVYMHGGPKNCTFIFFSLLVLITLNNEIHGGFTGILR